MHLPSKQKPRGETTAFYDEIVKPLAFIVACVVFTSCFYTSRGQANIVGGTFSCAASGDPTFPWQTPSSQTWKAGLILSITIPFGNFTFTQAKALDISWDLLIGKGGQALAFLMAYPILRRSLLLTMEQRSIHIPVLASLSFDKLSLIGLWALMKALFTKSESDRHAWLRWKLRLVCYVLIAIYVLSFATVVAAMTGYQARMTPYFKADSGDLVPSTQIDIQERIIVVDGQRIGMASDAEVVRSISLDGPSSLTSAMFTTLSEYRDTARTAIKQNTNPINDTSSPSRFWLSWIQLANGTRQWNASEITINDTSHSIVGSPLNVSNAVQLYRFQNNYLGRTWLQKQSICSPETTYQWGFASLLLFIFCIATILFGLLLTGLHTEVFFCSRSNRFKQQFGQYRDVIDVAGELHGELGDSVRDMTVDDLDNAITRTTGSVQIHSDQFPMSRSQKWRSRPRSKLKGVLHLPMHAVRHHSSGLVRVQRYQDDDSQQALTKQAEDSLKEPSNDEEPVAPLAKRPRSYPHHAARRK